MLQQEFIASTDGRPYHLSKMELASLFGSELPTAGGVRAEVRGEGSCIGRWGGLDRSLRTFSVKGQIVNTAGLAGHVASVAATQPHRSLTEAATHVSE